jgi:hypothetical protein
MLDWASLLIADVITAAGGGLVVISVIMSKWSRFSTIAVTYKWLAMAVGAVLLIMGVYQKGALSERTQWEIKVIQANARASVAEEQARSATARVETIYVDKIRKVTETRVVIQEKIRDISVDIDSQCRVSPRLVELLNDAARNNTTGDAK